MRDWAVYTIVTTGQPDICGLRLATLQQEECRIARQPRGTIVPTHIHGYRIGTSQDRETLFSTILTMCALKFGERQPPYSSLTIGNRPPTVFSSTCFKKLSIAVPSHIASMW